MTIPFNKPFIIGKELAYADNSWNHLTRLVDDPQAGIDNNPAENAIRPIALGRNYAQVAIMLRAA